MEWDSCRGFCAFRTEIVSPVSLYLSRGSQRRPTREGLCHILERCSESLEERDESEPEKCGTELGNTGLGTSAGTVDFLWCCTTMLFIKITLSEPKASL